MTRNRPINEHIAYLLAQATRQVHQQLDEEFRSEGVPVEQWRILKLLVEQNGRPDERLDAGGEEINMRPCARKEARGSRRR